MTPDADVRDDDRFVFLASAIAEGTPIEWSQEEEGLSEDEAAILREMQSLESIASANAQLRLHFTDTEVTIGDRPRVAAPAPKSWRHLTILQKIAEGGFGGIYKAHDSVLATDVALKLLAPRGTTGDLNESRILREARLLAKVRHPNVVTIYGADHTHERVGLWMEFIKGRTLEHLLRTQGPFGAREAALIGLDLCRAVAAVHRAGLIHGDIKAHNVMREEGGRTVLMDFGASRDVTQTGDHDVVGTPVYLAPEVLSGKPQTKASDIYALGILLYHLLTNDYPVGGQTWSEVVRKHERGDLARLRDARPDLPEEFVRVVERATAADPNARYASAGAFETALSHFIDPSPRPVVGSQNWKSPVLLLAGLFLLVAVGWLSRSWFVSNRETPQANAPEIARPSSPIAPAGASYDIDASFYRVTDAGDERLAAGSRLSPGDRLLFTVQTTAPTHVYIVNEPEQGEPYLLFPLPGQRVTNPLPANQRIRLPGDMYWQVTSAGGKEHFVVFASPDRVPAFEEAFAALATPTVGREPSSAAPLPAGTAERLRGVGGLVAAPRSATDAPRFSSLFTLPLPGTRETAQGLWVRRLTVENPAR